MPFQSTGSPAERLAARSERNEIGCWPFRIPTKLAVTYPRLKIDGRVIRTHRLAYMLASGEPIPSGGVIGHTCDNTFCVRNDEEGTYEVDGQSFTRWGHLFLTTSRFNTRDCHTKGRMVSGDRHWSHLHPENVLRGDTSPSRKHPESRPRGVNHWTRAHPEQLALSDDAVRDIRAIWDAGGTMQRDLAERFGVSQSLISRIVHRQRWTHLG